MFSGIVQALLPCIAFSEEHGCFTLAIHFNDAMLQELEIGASVAIEGVCLTVVAIDGPIVSFNVIEQTRKLTTLNHVAQGQLLNIERALRYNGEIGGHLMSGHIDGTLSIAAIDATPSRYELLFSTPHEWQKYIVPQGFIGINGVSLTIATSFHDTDKSLFSVCLIPETLRRTSLSLLKPGDRVNIELDAQTKAIAHVLDHLLNRPLQPSTN